MFMVLSAVGSLCWSRLGSMLHSWRRLGSACEQWLAVAGSFPGLLGSVLPFSHSAEALLPLLQPHSIPRTQQSVAALPDAAVAAEQLRFTLLCPLTTVPGSCSLVTAAATAAASWRAAKPKAMQSRPLNEQPCSLHACLLRHGIDDLGPFSMPKHLALSQEAVGSDVEPKLAALAAEGLSPAQMARLLSARGSPLWCNYERTFQPNLALLLRITAQGMHEPHPLAPQLTAVGRMLAGAPVSAARYLSRDHCRVERLVGWLEGSLGIGLSQLAGCKTPYNALVLPVEAAQAACSLLLEQGVPVEEVARVFLAQPTLFRCSSELLQGRLGYMQRELGLGAAAALRLAVRHPRLIIGKLEASLPPLLQFLDAYMGEVGAGRRLALATPFISSISAKTAERGVDGLAARGYSRERIRAMISSLPPLLALDLGSPLQQQKLDWIATVSPWTLDDFLANPVYLSVTTRRLASRLDFIQEQGLEPPSSPCTLATYGDTRFMSAMHKQLEKQGREPAGADWAAWEAAWLQTEAGKKWGYPPLKC